jgi:hypothetical protein
MGVYGITLPFLVGALSRSSGATVSMDYVRSLLDEIVNRPVPDHLVEVRWCEDIDAPVFNVAKLDYPYRMPVKSKFVTSTGEPSLGFSENLQSMFGLNCTGEKDCLEKLVEYAWQYLEKGHFSRNQDPKTGEYQYGDFSKRELRYIADVLSAG